MTEALVVLAAAGGTAVVGAMATDAWRAIRDGIAGLFGRRGAHRRETVIAALERDAELLAAADDGEREHLRRELTLRWRQQIADLLGDDPEAADELRDLLATAHSAGSTVLVQHNVAHNNARTFAVQGGDMHYHEHTAGSATEPDEAG